jgi:hydroxymethylbilane synthase
VAALVQPLDDLATHAAVQAERRVLEVLGAGCRLPVGALGRVEQHAQLGLVAAVAAVDGSRIIWARAVGLAAEPRTLGEQVATRLLSDGAATLLAPGAPLGVA